MCSPVYEGQARTGPSGRQQEVGAGENVRTGRGSRPDPWSLPAENWLRKVRRAPITGADLGQPSKGTLGLPGRWEGGPECLGLLMELGVSTRECGGPTP